MPKSPPLHNAPRVSLKTLAEHLGLSPATVSFVLNEAPNRSISQATRDRVKAAARKFGYQPSLVARSLQGLNTFTVGILLPHLGEGYHSHVLGGAGDLLMHEGYFFFAAHHWNRKDLIEQYPGLLQARGAEGIIAIDSSLQTPPPVPTVIVGGSSAVPGVTSIVLNHLRAAELALGHLYGLGHRKIAFMRGHDSSSDSNARWAAIDHVARDLRLEVAPENIIPLGSEAAQPETGYTAVQRLVRQHRAFTALVCFNDATAMGAIRALHEAGLRVPQDVSVVGYDDVQFAGYNVPSLTTVHQPLRHMGALAASVLLKKMTRERQPDRLTVEPDLVTRESSGPAPRQRRRGAAA